MKKILSFIFISALLTAIFLCAVHAESYPSWFPDDPENFVDFYGTDLRRVADEADLFTDAEESELTRLINEIRDKYGYDLVIYTDKTNYGLGPDDEQCAIDFYRFNGYGLGREQSGMIIYVNMDPDDQYFSVVGTGDVEQRTYEYNETIRDQMRPEMSAKNYYDAMKIGIELIDELYDTGKIAEKKTVGDYLGALNVLFGLGGNDPQAARETFLQYQLITPKTNIAAELHEDFLCKLLNDATGQTMLTTDTPDAPVLRGDLADLLYQLSGGAGE